MSNPQSPQPAPEQKHEAASSGTVSVAIDSALRERGVFKERRRVPREAPKVPETPPPPPPAPKLDDYGPIIGKPQLDEIRFLGEALRGRSVKMVNSTAMGGGVAELLNRLVPLLNELEVHTGWEVMTGGNDFFEITKAFHNALHGGSYTLTQSAQEIFMAQSELNRNRMTFGEDLVVIHDPQPAALVQSKKPGAGQWIWRCHIDLSTPHRGVWEFLRPMVEKYDAAIVSSPSFAQPLSVPQYLFYPCIDPLSEKNKELDDATIQKVCDNFGIDRSRPIVTQVSRFDRLKDPLGVIQAYKMARKYVDCQLVLAGGSAADDPEGAAVLQEVMAQAENDEDIIVLNLPPWSALEINALQRASTIVVQKSLREGFGLTVTEALWKSKPVIAGDVGGIPTQVIHNLTGVLVHSVEGCAYQIRYLLTHPERAQELGKYGKEHVKENFLMTANLRRWLLLYRILLGLS